jgi:hypothetical protein
MKRGRPSSAEEAAKRASDDEFRTMLVRQAYDRPMDALGEFTFRMLVRDLQLATEALTKANGVLFAGPVLNRVGIESQIAALTRTTELARAYPESLRVQVDQWFARRLAAEDELRAATAAERAAKDAETAWLDEACAPRDQQTLATGGPQRKATQ